ncbi:MAG: nucleotidyltransferase family protein [Halorientalis sp.]
METGGDVEESLDEATLIRIREFLSRHCVSFAMVFGSVARSDATTESDLDLAVSFEDVRPEDDGYSDRYLRLRSDLDDVVPFDVDVVDVHTMSESFASVAFEHGEVVRGSEADRSRLKSELAGDELTTGEAKNRVTAATERLRETSVESNEERPQMEEWQEHAVDPREHRDER